MALVMLPCDLPWWGTLQKHLTQTSEAQTPKDFVDGMQKIHNMCNVGLDPDEERPDPSTFDQLENFLSCELTSEECDHFLRHTAPAMVRRALQLKALKPPAGMYFSLQQQANSVEYERSFIASLLAHAFFSTFPRRTLKTHPTLQDCNFTHFFKHLDFNFQKSKLRSILHYFDYLEKNEPKGKITFTRQVMTSKDWLTIEDWLESELPLCPLAIRHEGKIERADASTVHLCFATNRIGGQTLDGGASQESVQFCTKPELLAVLPSVEALEDNEVFSVYGLHQMSRINDPRRKATLELVDDPPLVGVCCMDAENYMKLPLSQYEEDNILRELNKALLGFGQNRKPRVPPQPPARRLTPIGESFHSTPEFEKGEANISLEKDNGPRDSSMDGKADPPKKGLLCPPNMMSNRAKFIVLGSSGECLPVTRQQPLVGLDTTVRQPTTGLEGGRQSDAATQQAPHEQVQWDESTQQALQGDSQAEGETFQKPQELDQSEASTQETLQETSQSEDSIHQKLQEQSQSDASTRLTLQETSQSNESIEEKLQRQSQSDVSTRLTLQETSQSDESIEEKLQKQSQSDAISRLTLQETSQSDESIEEKLQRQSQSHATSRLALQETSQSDESIHEKFQRQSQSDASTRKTILGASQSDSATSQSQAATRQLVTGSSYYSSCQSDPNARKTKSSSSFYSSCKSEFSSEHEFLSATGSLAHSDSDNEGHAARKYSTQLDTPERRSTFAERLRDALRRETLSTSTSTDDSSYAVGITVAGSDLADPNIRVKRGGSRGFVLQEDSLDDQFLRDSLEQEREWIEKFRTKRPGCLSKRDTAESSKYSFSTEYSSELEELYDQFSRWMDDTAASDSNAKRELRARDIAVVKFAGSVLKRALSESYTGVTLSEMPGPPADCETDKSRTKIVLAARSLSLELARHKDKLAAHLVSLLGEEDGVRPVATGNWGCGSANVGDPQLKLIIQWLAASVAGTPVLYYYTCGHHKLLKLDTVCRVLLDRQWTVGELVCAVLKYASGSLIGPVQPLGNVTLFDTLLGSDARP